MITFYLLILLAAVLFQPSPRAAYHLIILLASAGLYAAPLPVDKIRRVGRYPAAIVLAWIIIAPWNQGNIMAMYIWSLFYFTLDDDDELITPENLTMAFLTCWAMLTTNSEGGWLALAAGIATLYYGRRGLAVVGIAEILLTVFKTWGPAVNTAGDLLKTKSFATGGSHVGMLLQALEGFLRQPFGHGLGQYEYWSGTWGAWHAHNLVADAGYALGVGGLVLLAIIGLGCWRANKPRRVEAFLSAFFIHSMVDGPIWYMWPLLILTLKEVKFERYYLSVWGAFRLVISGYRPGPTDTAAAPVNLDARPADTAGPVERG